ncbi:MAG: hypothetical protein FAZ92_02331 [Accumulibacter sp.]|nr:MAG: hypothetical protein FAZ92_02331 [Accumulibacter sp.]
MREQVEALEDHPDLAADGVQVLDVVAEDDAVDDDLARVMRFEAVQGAQEGGLAGPRRPDDGGDLPLVERRRDVPERVEGTEALADRARLDDRSRDGVRDHGNSR